MTMSRKALIPGTLFEEKDEFGTEYIVVDRNGYTGNVQVFFDAGVLMLRQENEKTVDMMELTLGQANDLLYAISKALSIPVRVM